MSNGSSGRRPRAGRCVHGRCCHAMAIVISFVMTTAVVATWVVPPLHGVSDVVRHVLSAAAMTPLTGILARWGWRAIKPVVVKRVWDFLGDPPKDPEADQDAPAGGEPTAEPRQGP